MCGFGLRNNDNCGGPCVGGYASSAEFSILDDCNVVGVLDGVYLKRCFRMTPPSSAPSAESLLLFIRDWSVTAGRI